MTAPTDTPEVPLQPLRIPPGWRVNWNTLFEIDPTPESAARGFFGGSSLFAATSVLHRSAIDIEWRPEDDPAGSYYLRVLYAPWKRTPKGRRVNDGRLDFDWTDPVHTFETRSRSALVAELEKWFQESPGPRFECS